jgi:serine/threonine protein kinase
MMTHPGHPLPTLAGFAYTAQRFLDTGSKMSEVLLALDHRQRPVVIKIASVEQRSRAEVNRHAITNTITWLQRLGPHPGLISLRPIAYSHQLGWRARFTRPTYCATLADWPGQPEFLVMEFLAGGSLRDFVRNQRLSVELALWIAQHIAQTLAHLHQHGCVHRDLKPENILFRTPPASKAQGRDALPILIDFGVAAQAGEEKLVSGSRLWMAPELQAAFEKHPLPVNPAWDVYALGLILCYLLTGRRPRHRSFDEANYQLFAEQTFAVIDSELAGDQRHAPGINSALKRLISQSLAKHPAQRPTSEEFARRCADLLTHLGSAPAGPKQLAEPVHYRQWLPRLPRLAPSAIAGSLILLLLILAGVVLPRSLPRFGWPALPGEETAYAAEEDAAKLAAPTPSLAPGANPTETPPAPTLAAIPPARTLISPTVTTPPPTLVAWTGGATPPPPTLALAALPTAPAPTLVTTPMNVPPGRVMLLSPAHGASSAQARVLYRWQITGQPLAADDCFALVFWDPHNETVKWSPLGASKAEAGRVDLAELAQRSDQPLRVLLRAHAPFHWGVQLVSCASPSVVVRAVEEVRAYTYEGP